MILAPVSLRTSKFGTNPQRRTPGLAGSGAAAAGILLVWAMLWAWMIVDVVGPLSRLPFQHASGSARAVAQERS